MIKQCREYDCKKTKCNRECSSELGLDQCPIYRAIERATYEGGTGMKISDRHSDYYKFIKDGTTAIISLSKHEDKLDVGIRVHGPGQNTVSDKIELELDEFHDAESESVLNTEYRAICEDKMHVEIENRKLTNI